jgi:hypothetical protein
MMNSIRWAGAATAAFLAVSQGAFAQQLGTANGYTDAGNAAAYASPFPVAKAALAQTLGSRSTVTSSATLFGGFELRQVTTVYILVRGNSLQTLGVTNNFLDAPRVRLFNAAGQDLVVDTFNQAGFNGCTTGSEFTDPVVSYYATVRGQPAHGRDACFAGTFQPGVYTFTVTPTIPGVTAAPQSSASNPSSGQVLFEVTLNP